MYVGDNRAVGSLDSKFDRCNKAHFQNNMIASKQASVFNDENKGPTTTDAVKISISPLRTRKPLQSLGNTPSKQNYRADTGTGVDKWEKPAWVEKTAVARSSSNESDDSASYEFSMEGSQKHIYISDRLGFNATNKLNVSGEATSSEESFDQGLQNEHTVFRDLLFTHGEVASTLFCGPEYYSPNQSEEDFFFIQRANPITEDSICEDSNDCID
jgi:hypothetical protein